MTQNILFIPISKLSISPTNVRRHSDPAADAQLEASIAEHGILQNLVGVPIARKKGHYRIAAGGRRLAAVERLIAKGILASDHLLPVLPLEDAANAIEISLVENFQVLAMNPADACRAFQDIIVSENKTAADVARRFGLTERFVLGRLRLAALADPIFTALAEGAISLDVATAYASTADTDRQVAVYDHLGQGHYRHNVAEIRRQIAAYSYRASDPKALLVGHDAYVAAGGRIERDLFSDSDSERWIDPQIVDTLAEQSLQAAAEAMRMRDSLGEVRILAQSDVPWSETRTLQPLSGEPVIPSEAERARIVEIEAEIEALEGEEAAEDSEDALDRLSALDEELASLQDRTMPLTQEQRAQAIAYVVIGPDGQPCLDAQLYRMPVAVMPDDEADPDVDADDAVDDGARPAISQRLGDELATMKTELLALHVARDPHFALELGTFVMIEAAVRPMGSFGIPSDLRAGKPSTRANGFESNTAAAAQWDALERGLDRSWTQGDTIEVRYDGFCALSDDARAAWLGWAVARTLHAVPAGKTGSGFLDHLGVKLAIDVAAWWRPTARTYFDRISRPAILSLLEGIGGPDLRQRHSSARKHDLALSAEKLFAGDIIVDAEVKARALAWLPDEMRFASLSDEAVAGDDRASEIEADGAAGDRDVRQFDHGSAGPEEPPLSAAA